METLNGHGDGEWGEVVMQGLTTDLGVRQEYGVLDDTQWQQRTNTIYSVPK